jgi:predicted Zn-dependent peptidase
VYGDTTTTTGIRVITEAMPTMRSVALGLWFQVGSRDEDAVTLGCSHFLEHLLFKGTTRRRARDIAEALDAIGGEANAFTSRETTCFYARVLDRDLPVAMDVLADMIRDATNGPDDVEAEREVVLEEIAIHLDTPDDLVFSDLSEVAYDGHPIGRETLGTADGIAQLQRDTIDAWFRDHYRPQDLVVVAVGNIDHDAVVALVDDLLGDLGRPGSGALPRTRPGPVCTGAVHVRRRPTEQVHVAVGGPGLDAHDDRRTALRVANTVLGGGMSSRLFQRIREEHGLAYTTFSFLSSFTDTGLLGAYVGTTPAKLDRATALLVEELRSLPETLTADEVERARAAMIGGTVLGLEDPGSRMMRLGQLAISGRELQSIDDAIARLERVTIDDVAAAAKLFAEPRSIAVVGPVDDDPARFADAVA